MSHYIASVLGSWSLALARGAAAATIAAVVVLSVVLYLGAAESWSLSVFLVGVAAGVLWGAVKPNRLRVEVLGVSLVGLIFIAAGLSSGWGWYTASGALGSVAALTWMLAGRPGVGSWWRWFRGGGVMIPILAILILPLVLDGGALGYDEAAYAVKSRSWLIGTPDTGWQLHRGLGMSAYGYLVLALEGGEPGLRMLGLVSLIALVVGAWGLGMTMANDRVGALAVVGVVAGPAILYRSTEYLSDIPSTSLLLLCMLILWRELEVRDVPTYQMVWVAPLALLAFFLRYQSLLSLSLIGTVTAVLWRHKIRQRPGPVIATAAVGLVGLIPFGLLAASIAGSPWGLVTFTTGVASRDYVGQGLVDYFRQLRWRLAGFVGPVALVASSLGVAAVMRNADSRRRFLFLLVPAFLQVLVLGLLSHGEPRFLFLPVCLVVIAAAIAFDSWASRASANWTRAAEVGTGMLLIGSFALAAASVGPAVDSRESFYSPAQRGAEKARGLVGDDSCAVMTDFSAVVTFYSGCFTAGYRINLEPQAAVDNLEGNQQFLLLIEGDALQPKEEDLDGLLDLTDRQPIVVEGPEGQREAVLYRFTR